MFDFLNIVLHHIITALGRKIKMNFSFFSSFVIIKPTAFGLDISDSFIKIIQLKKRGKFFKLVSWGEKQIPVGVVENGEIKNESRFLEILKQVLKDAKGKKIKTRNAVVSLLFL